MSFKYLLVVRSSLNGPIVDSWHLVDSNNPEETKAVIFGMAVRSKVNMSSGILCVECDKEATAENMETYLRSLTQDKFNVFITAAKISANGPLLWRFPWKNIGKQQ